MKPASAPDSLPIGVRAVETMTEPGIGPPEEDAAARRGERAEIGTVDASPDERGVPDG